MKLLMHTTFMGCYAFFAIKDIVTVAALELWMLNALVILQIVLVGEDLIAFLALKSRWRMGNLIVFC
jgi:hypothetical protein